MTEIKNFNPEKFKIQGPFVLGIDSEGRILMLNEKCRETLGYTEGELLECPIWDFFPSEYGEKQVMNFFLSDVRDTLPDQKIIPWVKKDGEKRKIKWKSIQLKNSKGKVESTLAMGIDLQPYENMRNRLIENEQIFEKIIEKTGFGMFIAHTNSTIPKIKRCNTRLGEILGYGEEELKDKELDSIFHANSMKKLRNAIEDLLDAEGEEKDIKLSCEKKNGEELKVNLNLISVQIEERNIILGLMREINEYTEKELKQKISRLKYYRSIVDYAGVGIIIVQNKEISYLNEHAGKIFDCSKDELKSQGIFSFVHPEDKEEAETITKERIEQETPFRIEYRIITKKGKVRFLSTQSVEVEYEGEPGTQLIVEDVTKYKEIERKLRNRREELSQAYTRLRNTESRLRERKKQLEKMNEIRTQFIDSLSHELNSLLSPAKMYVDMIRSEEIGEINRKQKEKLSEVWKRFNRIEDLTEDLLDLSKMEADKLKIRKESITISDILLDVIDDLRDDIERKDHELEVTIPDSSLEMIGDPRLLDKVFRNLISNAIRYTPCGGRIEVRTEKRPEKILVSVADTGPGIPEQKQEKIFEKFYRAEEGNGDGGLGVGLALSKHFVELHEGNIQVESEPGEGSNFTVTLPNDGRG